MLLHVMQSIRAVRTHKISIMYYIRYYRLYHNYVASKYLHDISDSYCNYMFIIVYKNLVFS